MNKRNTNSPQIHEKIFNPCNSGKLWGGISENLWGGQNLKSHVIPKFKQCVREMYAVDGNTNW